MSQKLDDAKMANESKELPPDVQEEVKKSPGSEDGGIIGVALSVMKKVAFVGVIYLVGYMNWSVAWLIGPVILSAAREQWQKSAEMKRNIAKASAMANEKDVILARIDDLPAWVYFPDVERCEWLNRILQQVWPNANYIAHDLVKNVIEPKIAHALSKFKLSGFKFDRIILGTIPPRIGGVKVYDMNISRHEIIMDIDLFYASNCDINFVLSGMKGGLKDFQIHGMVRVIMKPLITKIPLVGGLQIFFLNNPDIDFNLVGVVDLLDMPGLSDMLRKIIVEQIASIMVLPNKLPITLSDEVPAVALRMPAPEGFLRIHVVEAKDLMKKDIGVLGKGKSDPYAIVTVGAQQFKTQTIDNTINPKWDYWCETVVLSGNGQSLDIQLFDQDGTSDDEKLGRATVEISSVIKNGILDTWITLEEAKHGMVHLRLTWLELSRSATDLAAALEETQQLRVTAMSTAVLSVYIDSAKNLPEARTSKPDPYLVVSVGKKSEQTDVVMRNDSPVWEQGYTFLVSNPANDVMQLKVVDQKTGSELGRLSYVIGTLLEKDNMEIALQPFQLSKSGPDTKVIMSFALRILKPTSHQNDSAIGDSIDSQSSTLSRQSSNLSSKVEQTPLAPLRSSVSSNDETGSVKEALLEPVSASSVFAESEMKHNADTQLRHRRPSMSGSDGLGRIQLTLRYSLQRQRLIVIVHKITNIPLKDPSNIPDPYVKLYLLPGRSKETKRKTNVIKDDCNPVYDATFEYVISAAELLNTTLEVTVASQKGFLSGGSPVIGLIHVPLINPDISLQGFTAWYDLLDESKFD